MSLGVICAAGLVPLSAQAQSAGKDAVAYCKSTGGKVETYRFYDMGGREYAKPAHVCNYPDASGSDPFGHAIVDLAVLYSVKPTLAALAYYGKPAWDGKGFGNPSANYCRQLGASPANQGSWSLTPGGDQSGMCMFEDGSFMEQWTLFYNQAGTPRGVDLTTVLRFKPNLR